MVGKEHAGGSNREMRRDGLYNVLIENTMLLIKKDGIRFHKNVAKGWLSHVKYLQTLTPKE